MYDVDENGNLSGQRKFADVPTPDGLTLDEHYNVYVASYSEGMVMVFDSSGTKLGNISILEDDNPRGNTSNCVFGLSSDPQDHNGFHCNSPDNQNLLFQNLVIQPKGNKKVSSV